MLRIVEHLLDTLIVLIGVSTLVFFLLALIPGDPVDVILGESAQAADRDAMRAMIHGKKVLVTGAGGSIGSELARQAADFGPAELVLVENSEYALYAIDMELSRRTPDVARRAVICDVRDRARLDASRWVARIRRKAHPCRVSDKRAICRD